MDVACSRTCNADQVHAIAWLLLGCIQRMLCQLLYDLLICGSCKGSAQHSFNWMHSSACLLAEVAVEAPTQRMCAAAARFALCKSQHTYHVCYHSNVTINSVA